MNFVEKTTRDFILALLVEFSFNSAAFSIKKRIATMVILEKPIEYPSYVAF